MPLFAIPFPAIDPVAIALGPFAIRWYALAYVVGLLGGWYYAKRLAADAALWAPLRQPTAIEIDDLIVWVALGVVLGAVAVMGFLAFIFLSVALTIGAVLLVAIPIVIGFAIVGSLFSRRG